MEKIYSISASNFVLGTLMNNTSLIYNSTYPLEKSDFKPFLIHKIIYVCISQLADKGVEKVEPIEIVNYLNDYPEQLNSLQEELNDGDIVGYVKTLKELTDDNHNYSYWWSEVKKRSCLRAFRDNGFDISDFWNVDKDNEENEKNLNKYTIADIVDKFDMICASLKNKFVIDEDTTEKQAGDNGQAILDAFEQDITMGLGLESKYLTTLWGGINKKQVYIRSGDTSSGKSRSLIGDLSTLCCEKIYNLTTNTWDYNPNGKHRGLYIGSEMELDFEVDPIFWSYISGVESSKIIHHKCTPTEYKRVQEAIDIVNDKCLWLVDMPSFNIRKVEDKIKEYKQQYDIEYVAFDYILLNNQLVKEFVESRGRSGVGARGDEILGELAKALKNLAKKYDVGLLTATQVNSGISDYKARDYQVLRGSKQIADTCTGGSISMPITLMEKKLVDGLIDECPINKHKKMGTNRLEPNFVETVYKSRFSEYPKECKIFSYYDLGNMRKIEMFVTDKNFNPINIPKTEVNLIA